MSQQHNSPILQYQPWIDPSDVDAVLSYLRSGGFITEFKKTREFENLLASFCKSKYASIFPNGTLTLYSILKVLPTDNPSRKKVIVPNYTMAATAFSVVQAGYEPVFCDVEPDTLCLSYQSVVDAFHECKNQVIAVMFMAANGRYPSYDIRDLLDLADSNNAVVVEDAAQSLSSYYPSGDHIGTCGIAGSFSFSMPKIITTGQGGVVVTNDHQLGHSLVKFRDFGREISGGGTDFHDTIGLNMKFTDLQAALGISQLERINEIKDRKKANFAYLRGNLSSKYINLFSNDLQYTTPWFYEVFTEFRHQLSEHLKAWGVNSRNMYPELNKQSAFKCHPQFGEIFPVSADVSARGLWLPSHPLLSRHDLDRIVEAINSFCPV